MCCRQSGLINSAPILPCLTERCAQGQSGVSSRILLLKYWTYVVSAPNTWLCKVKYFGLIFAWLELEFQLVLFKANQEMLFIYALWLLNKHKTQLIWMSIREGSRKFLNFSIDSISLQIFILCVTRQLSKLNRVTFNNVWTPDIVFSVYDRWISNCPL